MVKALRKGFLRAGQWAYSLTKAFGRVFLESLTLMIFAVSLTVLWWLFALEHQVTTDSSHELSAIGYSQPHRFFPCGIAGLVQIYATVEIGRFWSSEIFLDVP